MGGGALGRAAGSALNRGPTTGSVMASTFLLAGSQALGILLEPTGVKRATFNDFSVSPGEASDTVSYIAGTVETVPHLISYFDFHSKKVKNDVQISQMLLQAGLDGLAGYVAGGGTFGLAPDPPTAYVGLAEGAVLGAIVAGLGQLRTASYRYYCGFLYGICHGPIDSIEAVKVDERIVHLGSVPAGNQFLIDDPQAWGGDHVDGGVYALCKGIKGDFWPTQQIDPYIAAQLGANTSSWSGKALFLMYGFTGYPESGYFAATPQGSPAVRPLKLRVRRLPNNLGVTAYHNLNGDANIAECCYEWLTSRVFGVKYLPLGKIDLASFQLAAQTLHTRGLGISLEMNADTDVETALDKFSALGDLIIYGSFNSGTIRCKVIERDYSFGSLPIFRRGPDGSSPELYNVVKVEGFTPGTWANTANDFTFDYVDRDNNYLKATRYVQDIANKMLTGRTRSLSQSLDGVSNGATAALVGTRELRAGSYPRPPINLSVNRDGYALEPGDVIRYIDNVDNFQKVLRVAEVQALATDSTAEIQLNCTEDQYGVGASAFAAYVPPGFSLTLHLHFEVEDSLSALGDALDEFVAVHTASAISDVLNLSDAISISLSAPTSITVSDSINNLADSFTSSAATISDPTTISGCRLWVRGDDPSDFSGFSDAQAIGTITNRGASGGDIGQGTAGNKPRYRTSGPNGKPYIENDTTGKFLQSSQTISNYFSASAWTFFMVIRPQAAGPAGAQDWAKEGFIKDLDDRWQFGNASSKFAIAEYNSGATSSIEYGSAYSTNTWYIVDVSFGGGTASLKVNGGTAVTGSIVNITSLANAMNIKGGGGINDWAEIAIWNVQISETDRDSFRRGLASKYAITIT